MIYDSKFSNLQEAIAIGRTFAAMKDYQIDGNKEMVALGTMNVVGSMTSCYVATGLMTLFVLKRILLCLSSHIYRLLLWYQNQYL